jgi:hypothetical protein
MPVIKVKKPFEPDPSASQPKPALPATVNPEFEEKHVVDSISKTSEDFHGGSELSFSLPNTSVSSPIPMPTSSQSSTSSSSEQLEPTSPSSETSNSKTEASEQKQSSTSSESFSEQSSGQTQLKSSSQHSSTISEESSGQHQQQLESSNSFSEQQSSQTPETTKTSEQTSKSSASSVAEQQLESSSEASTTESSAQESSAIKASEASSEETSARISEEASVQAPEVAEQHSTTEAGSATESEQTQAQATEANEARESGKQQDENQKQTQSYVFNTQQAFGVVDAETFNAKYYQTEFYRFIEMIAEEKTKFFDPYNAEEFNIKKLMFRPYERRPLQHYRMARVREAVVLILDNSGSMNWWAKNIQMLARLAMQRNDVEVYLAPNGVIEEMVHPRREIVNHNEVVKRLRNRKIIYVGDFDGANTPIELSWYNDVIWVCPETRYKHFREHDWVSYDESRFKGAFLRVFTLEQMFNAFKKLLSSPSLRLWYDLFDEYVSQEGEDMS